MKKWVWFTLLVILFLAVLLRLQPLLSFPIWGSDTGEYYYLTNHLSEEHQLEDDYNGWGFGYPYFPGMFILSSEVSMLSGLDQLPVLLILTPALSAFGVVIVFMLTRRLGGSDKAGLVAAAILAVAMPHVYATSHAMPGSLGDLLAMTALLLFINNSSEKKYFIPLILATIALVITHHLSTFILLLTLFFIVIFREVFKLPSLPAKRIKWDNLYIFILLILIVAYWFVYAEPFREGIISDNIGSLTPGILIAMAFIGFIIYIALIHFLHTRVKFVYEPKTYSPKKQLTYFTVVIIIGIIFFLSLITFRIPPLELKLDPAVTLYLSPLIIFGAFALLGLNETGRASEGMLLHAWILCIFILMAVIGLTGFQAILPYRLTQYSVVPLSVAAGCGFAAVYASISKSSNSKRTNSLAVIAVLFISLLMIISGMLAYPPKEVMSGFQEGINDYEMEGVIWVRDNLETGSTIATDHRLSSMLFGFAGMNPSWDYIEKSFFEEDFDSVREELNNTGLPSGLRRIDYVMLSDEMRQGVALVQWEDAEPMSEDALSKFEQNPFYLVYDSGKVQVYQIDWGYAN
jgi:hypothetical protein